jgi:division protein CdvB (Snf7/Vps24/ESCRT-III family)
MGFLDDLVKDVRAFTDEIQEIKEELVSSVLDPSGELRSTVNEIAGEITGKTTESPSETKSKN